MHLLFCKEHMWKNLTKLCNYLVLARMDRFFNGWDQNFLGEVVGNGIENVVIIILNNI